MSHPPLVVLAGATASGKSAIALAVAEALSATIIAADSRTVYRGFDVGTAKPTREERDRVPHRLLDVAEPDDTYTVARFKADASEAIAEVHRAGGLPLLVGGTGFYIRGLTGGLAIPEVAPQSAIRERLGLLPDPHARLNKVDPVSAARLHPNDLTRIIRALEVHEVLGIPLSQAARREEVPYDLLYLVLDLEREELCRRIDLRTHQMMAHGLVEEVQGLRERWGDELPLLQTLGYAETMAHLQGACGLDEAIAAIQQNTRRYAKRQLTWFRGEALAQPVAARDSTAAIQDVLARIASRFGARGEVTC